MILNTDIFRRQCKGSERGVFTCGVFGGQQCGLYGRGRQQPVRGEGGKGHLHTRGEGQQTGGEFRSHSGHDHKRTVQLTLPCKKYRVWYEVRSTGTATCTVQVQVQVLEI